MEKMNNSAFSLRFRKANLRESVRVLASREGISQNEFLEQAAEHEVIFRGALMADDLELASAQMRTLSADAYAALVEESLLSAAASESRQDPLRVRRISRTSELEENIRSHSPVGAVPDDTRTPANTESAFEKYK
jgi:hypothetical protein